MIMIARRIYDLTDCASLEDFLRAKAAGSAPMQTAGFASKGDVLFSSGEKSLVPSTIARGRR